MGPDYKPSWMENSVQFPFIPPWNRTYPQNNTFIRTVEKTLTFFLMVLIPRPFGETIIVENIMVRFKDLCFKIHRWFCDSEQWVFLTFPNHLQLQTPLQWQIMDLQCIYEPICVIARWFLQIYKQDWYEICLSFVIDFVHQIFPDCLCIQILSNIIFYFYSWVFGRPVSLSGPNGMVNHFWMLFWERIRTDAVEICGYTRPNFPFT